MIASDPPALSVDSETVTETVTVLFVHIYGAAALWESAVSHHQDVPAQCDAVLRDHIAAQGGELVKVTSEPTYFAVFANAVAALTCASAALAQIYRTHWPIAFGAYGLRAALTTGVPLRDGDDYLGPIINQCARLVESAAPWQILLTHPTAHRIGDAVFPDLMLIDLGAHPLRDMEGAVPLFEARHAALPCFPTRRLGRDSVSNLPATLTTFLGRKAECGRLLGLLRDPATRLVTLVGVGGCGKTRLAIETVRQIEPGNERVNERVNEHGVECVQGRVNERVNAHIQSVRFHAFTENLSQEAFLGALAEAVGAPRSCDGAVTTLDTLIAYLRERPCLLVLDNFERLIAHGRQLSELLHAVPGLQCVVTSRAPLRVPDEIVIDVPLLTSDEAVCLLAERVQKADVEWGARSDQTDALRAICAHLNGLPLALELAAPLLRGLSPTQLLGRMQQRHLDLGRPPRDMDPRHQSLRHCLEWSFETLSETDQQLFRRLAVFVGDFSPEAAQAICGAGSASAPAEASSRLAGLALRDRVETPWQTAEGLHRLCEQSLLTSAETDGRPRYRMLELVRAFAQEKLRSQPQEMDMLRWAHADYYARLVRETRLAITTRGDSPYFRLCTAEMPNIRAAMNWARNAGSPLLFADFVCHLATYFMEQGYWQELRLIAPQAMRSLEAAEKWSELFMLLSLNAHLAQRSGDFKAAIADLERALPLAERIGDPYYRCATIYNLGDVLKDAGEKQRARACIEAALAQAHHLNNALLIDVSRLGLGELALAENDMETAERLLTEVRGSLQRREDRLGVANVNVTLAQVAVGRGDFLAAHAYLIECLRIRDEASERYATLNALTHIARLFVSAQAPIAAAPLLRFLIAELEGAKGVLQQKAWAAWEECRKMLDVMPAEQARAGEAEKMLETLVAAVTYAQETALPYVCSAKNSFSTAYELPGYAVHAQELRI